MNTFLKVRHSKWGIFSGDVWKKEHGKGGFGLESQLVADARGLPYWEASFQIVSKLLGNQEMQSFMKTKLKFSFEIEIEI